MAASAEENFVRLVANHLRPLPVSGPSHALDAILQDVRGKRVVLLGESTHGTAEFYAIRRALTQELVLSGDLRIIALEADWPDARQFSRFIRGQAYASAVAALVQPRRWPTWMWSNNEFAHLMEWLKRFNRGRHDPAQIYGLDLYSLFESIDEILKSVRRRDPALAFALAERYECFNPFERDERAYARSLLHFPSGCREEVLANLHMILALRLGRIHTEESELFDVQQNARIVANAERYYRAVIEDDEASWNIRDRHMMETLELLLEHADPHAQAVVWAHNTHIGDYRGTSMNDRGYVNIGGLARESFGEGACALIGFSTYKGKTLAGPHWDGNVIEMAVPAAREGSLDALFQIAAERAGTPAFYLPLHEIRDELAAQPTRVQRAIGVVYDPYHERISNYVPTRLERRYDGIVFVSETHAVEEIKSPTVHIEPPETWPTGL
ncbi:MAG: erythromycin esterase family protein [Bdellovibrionaceae bacterium]|nr:erythromycin esterase family protein [Pseudobdellovibrionaceae bacterium]